MILSAFLPFCKRFTGTGSRQNHAIHIWQFGVETVKNHESSGMGIHSIKDSGFCDEITRNKRKAGCQ